MGCDDLRSLFRSDGDFRHSEPDESRESFVFQSASEGVGENETRRWGGRGEERGGSGGGRGEEVPSDQ